jgi:hypothetical protein
MSVPYFDSWNVPVDLGCGRGMLEVAMLKFRRGGGNYMVVQQVW